MDLKWNLNKIHSDLLSMFPSSEINITEKENKTYENYFQISIIKEGKEVKLNLRKIDLQNSQFNWNYYSNPLVEESHKVERNSTLDSFSSDVRDIFEKNRFDKDYLNTLNK